MAEWVYAVEGTETGHSIALALALLAAFLHAVFGALQKGDMIHGCRAVRWILDMQPSCCLSLSYWFLHLNPRYGPFCSGLGSSTLYTRSCKDTPRKGAYTVVYPSYVEQGRCSPSLGPI